MTSLFQALALLPLSLTAARTQMVHSMALVDPVCLMTCAPQLLSNFVYRLPPLRWRQLAASPDAAMDAARIVASRDLLIAASFCRRCDEHRRAHLHISAHAHTPTTHATTRPPHRHLTHRPARTMLHGKLLFGMNAL